MRLENISGDLPVTSAAEEYSLCVLELELIVSVGAEVDQKSQSRCDSDCDQGCHHGGQPGHGQHRDLDQGGPPAARPLH